MTQQSEAPFINCNRPSPVEGSAPGRGAGGHPGRGGGGVRPARDGRVDGDHRLPGGGGGGHALQPLRLAGGAAGGAAVRAAQADAGRGVGGAGGEQGAPVRGAVPGRAARAGVRGGEADPVPADDLPGGPGAAHLPPRRGDAGDDRRLHLPAGGGPQGGRAGARPQGDAGGVPGRAAQGGHRDELAHAGPGLARAAPGDRGAAVPGRRHLGEEAVTAAPRARRGGKWIVALSVTFGTLMGAIDASIVNVALSQIRGAVGATVQEITWISTGFAIATVMVMPLTGFFGRMFGQKKIYLFCLVLFVVGSALCGIAWSLP